MSENTIPTHGIPFSQDASSSIHSDTTSSTNLAPIPADIQSALEDFYKIVIVGDEQIHYPPHIQKTHRALGIHRRAPGHRLEGTSFGIDALTLEIIYQAIPAEYRDLVIGIIHKGDFLDGASHEELAALKKLITKLPYPSISIDDSNHDNTFHTGSFSADDGSLVGINGNSLLMWILKIAVGVRGRNASYQIDIQGAELGGLKNLITKDQFVKFVYKLLYQDKIKPDATFLYASNQDNYTTSEEYADDESQIRKGSWADTAAVYNDFWKRSADGQNYNAYIHFKPDSNRNVHRQHLHIAAVKIKNVTTSIGDVPIYNISLNAMDFLRNTDASSALSGTVSAIQVKTIKALIQSIKNNPNLDKDGQRAKFIINSHYPITSISGARESGLLKLLEDESIIAYIGAHNHHRDFVNLAAKSTPIKYRVNREQPLPQITVPAVIDYPNELVVMEFGVNPKNAAEVMMQFTFKGVDQNKIPGKDAIVDAEVERLKPYLLSYRDAVAHMNDPQVREFANPESTLGDQIVLALHIDEGLIFRSGDVQDTLVAKDVIPAMVEGSQLYVRLFDSLTKLALFDLNLKNEALTFSNKLSAYSDCLNSYYERIHKKIFYKKDEEQAFRDNLYAKENELLDYKQELSETLIRHMDENYSHGTDAKTLHVAYQLINNLPRYLVWYKNWLDIYKIQTRDGSQKDENLSPLANLYANPSFRQLLVYKDDFDYGSREHAFKTMIALESAKQEVQYYKATLEHRPLGGKVKDVPNTISVRVKLAENTITTDPLETQHLTEEARQQTIKDLGHLPEAPEDLTKENLPSPETDRPYNHNSPFYEKLRGKLTAHTIFQLGYRYGTGLNNPNPAYTDSDQWSGWNSGFLIEGGRQFHLVDDVHKPRVNLRATTGLEFEWQKRDHDEKSVLTNNIEFPFKFSFTLGDPLGLIEAGPVGGVGPALRQTHPDLHGTLDAALTPAFMLSVGGQLCIFEGMACIEGGYKWYKEGFSNPLIDSKSDYLGIQLDFARIFSIFLGDRQF